MLKLFVFPTRRHPRLDRFLIVATLFFVTLLLGSPCGYVSEGLGVYREGKRLEALSGKRSKAEKEIIRAAYKALLARFSGVEQKSIDESLPDVILERDTSAERRKITRRMPAS